MAVSIQRRRSPPSSPEYFACLYPVTLTFDLLVSGSIQAGVQSWSMCTIKFGADSSNRFGPILWGHSGPLCHALSLLMLWTSMRRRRATAATPGKWQCKTGGVRRLAVANGPNIFQMLLVISKHGHTHIIIPHQRMIS